MSDAYRKVGRGGAGNYYSKQDITDATKDTTTDTESQTPSSSTPRDQPASSHQPAPEYQHTGRGGAGNWVAPSDLASHGLSQQSEDLQSTATSRPSEAPATRVMGSSKPTYRGGRGGAGNYFDDGEEMRRVEEERVEEEKRKAEVEGRVQEDVERGLRRPERAYGGN